MSADHVFCQVYMEATTIDTNLEKTAQRRYYGIQQWLSIFMLACCFSSVVLIACKNRQFGTETFRLFYLIMVFQFIFWFGELQQGWRFYDHNIIVESFCAWAISFRCAGNWIFCWMYFNASTEVFLKGGDTSKTKCVMRTINWIVLIGLGTLALCFSTFYYLIEQDIEINGPPTSGAPYFSSSKYVPSYRKTTTSLLLYEILMEVVGLVIVQFSLILIFCKRLKERRRDMNRTIGLKFNLNMCNFLMHAIILNKSAILQIVGGSEQIAYNLDTACEQLSDNHGIWKTSSVQLCIQGVLDLLICSRLIWISWHAGNVNLYKIQTRRQARENGKLRLKKQSIELREDRVVLINTYKGSNSERKTVKDEFVMSLEDYIKTFSVHSKLNFMIMTQFTHTQINWIYTGDLPLEDRVQKSTVFEGVGNWDIKPKLYETNDQDLADSNSILLNPKYKALDSKLSYSLDLNQDDFDQDND